MPRMPPSKARCCRKWSSGIRRQRRSPWPRPPTRQLLALSGLRSPYPGKLGVVEEGALADLLLVDGNPVDNIKLIEDPEINFVVIMKDGRIYKNTLRR